MEKRFAENRSISFLREAAFGMAIQDLCWRHGSSDASYYLWRSKFCGMSVPDATQLKNLKTDSTRLKTLLAEQPFENDLIYISCSTDVPPS